MTPETERDLIAASTALCEKVRKYGLYMLGLRAGFEPQELTWLETVLMRAEKESKDAVG